MNRERTNRKRNSPIVLFAIFATLLSLTSCERGPAFSHYEHFGSDGWRKNDALHYSICPEEAAPYNMFIDLRMCSLYPYTQLTLLVRSSHSNGSQSHTDTINIETADPEGNRTGNGLNIKKHHIDLPQVVLAPNDTFSITVAHNMSREYLPGIIDIGVIAERQNDTTH